MTALPGYWSWSQLETLMSCGRKYQLSYLDKVPRKAKGYFVGGSSVHTAIEESEAHGWWGDPDRFQKNGEAVEFFHLELERQYSAQAPDGDIDWGGRKTKAFPEGENLAWWHGQGPSMLRRYASLRREDSAKGWPLPQTEVGFTFAGPSDKPVKGRIDQLFLPMAHEVGSFSGVVRDYKTGARYSPDTPMQLVIYALACRALELGEPTVGQFIYLRAQDGRLVHEVDLSQWFPMFDLLFTEWSQQLETGLFLHRPSNWCKTCDVASWCEVGKRIHGED